MDLGIKNAMACLGGGGGGGEGEGGGRGYN